MATNFEECYGELKAVPYGFGKVIISMDKNTQGIGKKLIESICGNGCPDKNNCQYKQDLIHVLSTDKISI